MPTKERVPNTMTRTESVETWEFTKTATPVSIEEPLHIALDMESVLANTFSYLISEYNATFGTTYTVSDIDDWDWVRTEIDYDNFMEIMDAGWRDEYTAIEPVEPDLPGTVKRLANDPHFVVDIVTGRTGVDDGMKAWLDHHGITGYNRFRSVSVSKATLPYQVYIDDKPKLREELGTGQWQYLIRGPHNEVPLDGHQATAVDSVQDAVTDLLTSLESVTGTRDADAE